MFDLDVKMLLIYFAPSCVVGQLKYWCCHSKPIIQKKNTQYTGSIRCMNVENNIMRIMLTIKIGQNDKKIIKLVLT